MLLLMTSMAAAGCLLVAWRRALAATPLLLGTVMKGMILTMPTARIMFLAAPVVGWHETGLLITVPPILTAAELLTPTARIVALR
jgi:hypothetical protein